MCRRRRRRPLRPRQRRDHRDPAPPRRGVRVHHRDDRRGRTRGRYSSSRIRDQIISGDVAEAADQLGRYHRVEGTVVHGDARGRDLGFPTANLSADGEGLIPADGVYAGWASFEGEDHPFPAAISVGTNPTFEGCDRRVEAYVLDKEFGEFDVYDRHMVLEFVARIRGQVAFSGLDDLIAQMHEDIADVREVLHT